VCIAYGFRCPPPHDHRVRTDPDVRLTFHNSIHGGTSGRLPLFLDGKHTDSLRCGCSDCAETPGLGHPESFSRPSSVPVLGLASLTAEDTLQPLSRPHRYDGPAAGAQSQHQHIKNKDTLHLPSRSSRMQ
jgi:hypothetical protein